jgi:hypothetical protein
MLVANDSAPSYIHTGRRWGEEGLVPGGRWLRAGLAAAVPPPAVPREQAAQRLLAALQAEDPEAAEQQLLAFLGPDAASAFGGRGQLMDVLLRVSNAYNLFDDHYFNFPIYTSAPCSFMSIENGRFGIAVFCTANCRAKGKLSQVYDAGRDRLGACAAAPPRLRALPRERDRAAEGPGRRGAKAAGAPERTRIPLVSVDFNME